MASANLRREEKSPGCNAEVAQANESETGKSTIGFNNFAHAVDHYVMLIFPRPW